MYLNGREQQNAIDSLYSQAPQPKHQKESLSINLDAKTLVSILLSESQKHQNLNKNQNIYQFDQAQGTLKELNSSVYQTQMNSISHQKLTLLEPAQYNLLEQTTTDLQEQCIDSEQFSKQQKQINNLSNFIRRLQVPEYTLSSQTKWVRGFNFYFLGLAFILQILQSFFMVAINGYGQLFTILFTIFWLVIPCINLSFLLTDDTYKYNLLASNSWTIYFCLIIQICFCMIAWQLFIGSFAQYMDVNITSSSVTVIILEMLMYLIQGSLFVWYTQSLATDMGLKSDSS